MIRRLMARRTRPNALPTRSSQVADEDRAQTATEQYATLQRPVLRWIKGDGRDDAITRAAIGQATRLFGPRVDYCLCTNGIDAARVRDILAWSAEPVEWRPVDERDNPRLADRLQDAGCPPSNFGYWWKWFPDRVRANAPEWILDGDMVVTGEPTWFSAWAAGTDTIRISQDDRWSATEGFRYGTYLPLIDLGEKLYSGLISLPPGAPYMDRIIGVLDAQPLPAGHDGRTDMCEQGVVAAAFQQLEHQAIPLAEFPFALANAETVFHGEAPGEPIWGYHFGLSFRNPNAHFERMTSEGSIFSLPHPDVMDRWRWLGSAGQWGVPGWSLPDDCAHAILDQARPFAGRPTLDLGTSRGRLAGMLSDLGCVVTTVDHTDRGARANLAGLPIDVVIGDAVDVLRSSRATYDLICVDLHGNTPADWQRRARPLLRRVRRGGLLLLNNARLDELPGWEEEVGVRWLLQNLPRGWSVEAALAGPPGVVALRRR